MAHVKRVAKCLATPTFVDYMLSLTHLSRSTLEFITLTNVMTCSTNVPDDIIILQHFWGGGFTLAPTKWLTDSVVVIKRWPANTGSNTICYRDFGAHYPGIVEGGLLIG